MEISKKYNFAYFKPEVIKEAMAMHFDLTMTKRIRPQYRLTKFDSTSFEFDSESEFYSEYRTPHFMSTITKRCEDIDISVSHRRFEGTTVSVRSKNRAEIEEILEVFNAACEDSRYQDSTNETVIFIGHGRKPYWRELKEHLSDLHQFRVEAFESGSRAGHAVRDVLESLSSKSTLAILIMSGEDEGVDGQIRARSNVIHEIGLFQGKLGFDKAVVLLEEGTEEFSNLNGIQQIRFSKDGIRESFGDVVAFIKRETNR